jgi:hypothetical protein
MVQILSINFLLLDFFNFFLFFKSSRFFLGHPVQLAMSLQYEISITLKYSLFQLT